MNILYIENKFQKAVKIKNMLPLFHIDHISNPIQAILKARDCTYDLILSKLNMPILNGLSLAALLKKEHPFIPIILLDDTKNNQNQKYAMDIPIEEYLQDPVDMQILLYKILKYMPSNNSNNNYLKTKSLTMDISKGRLLFNQKTIPLFKKEFELLQFFFRNIEKVLTRTEILEYLWGYDITAVTNTIDVHIHRLRKKLIHHTKKLYRNNI